MWQLLNDRSRPILLALLVAGLLIATFAILVAAQGQYKIQVEPSVTEVAPDETVVFSLSYQLPNGTDASPPGIITARWSANATFVDASEGYEQIEIPSQIRWIYKDSLPRSTQLPEFTVKSGEVGDPIFVTATLIVSSTADIRTTVEVTETTVSVPITSRETGQEEPLVADLSRSSLTISPTGTIIAGSPVTMIVIVSNTGVAAAEGVAVTLPLNTILEDIVIAVESQALAVSEEPESGTFAFRLNDAVEPDTEAIIILNASVVPEAAGTIEVNGSIAAAGDLAQSIATTVAVQPALLPRLNVQIMGPSSITVGEALSLSLVISNSGVVAAEGITVTVFTDPYVDLSSADEIDASVDEGKLSITLIGLASEETVSIPLTTAPVNSDAPALFFTVQVQNPDQYDTASQLTDQIQIELQLQPSATPVSTATATSVPTEMTSTPTPTPAVIPPPDDGSSGTDLTRLLLIGIVALSTALAAGIVLFLLLRSRRKPTTPPTSSAATPVAPDPPGAVPATTPLQTGGAALESVAMPGKRLRLDPGVTTIGRAPDSTICIDERYMNWETVSRKHAEIRREGDYYVIRDLSNRNGVYVEGQRTAKNLLRSGWRVGIGGVEFIFRDAAADQ